jgi:hypothetical protein
MGGLKTLSIRDPIRAQGLRYDVQPPVTPVVQVLRAHPAHGGGKCAPAMHVFVSFQGQTSKIL